MEKFFNRLGVAGMSLCAVGIIGTRFVYVVDGGERAVIFKRFGGVDSKVHGEGMHFMLPFLHTPIKFEVRSRPRLITSTTGTKDLQHVDLTLRILFRPKEERIPEILNKLGQDYDERVLPSIGNEVLKQAVAMYDAGELITKREHVSKLIRNNLQQRAEAFGLILDDVAITHLKFQTEFQASIEAKQVAEQDAIRQKYVVKR